MRLIECCTCRLPINVVLACLHVACLWMFGVCFRVRLLSLWSFIFQFPVWIKEYRRIIWYLTTSQFSEQRSIQQTLAFEHDNHYSEACTVLLYNVIWLTWITVYHTSYSNKVLLLWWCMLVKKLVIQR